MRKNLRGLKTLAAACCLRTIWRPATAASQLLLYVAIEDDKGCRPGMCNAHCQWSHSTTAPQPRACGSTAIAAAPTGAAAPHHALLPPSGIQNSSNNLSQWMMCTPVKGYGSSPDLHPGLILHLEQHDVP